jgi:hypothetical protein
MKKNQLAATSKRMKDELYKVPHLTWLPGEKGKRYTQNTFCRNCGARIVIEIPKGIEIQEVTAKIKELKSDKDKYHYEDIICGNCGCKVF